MEFTANSPLPTDAYQFSMIYTECLYIYGFENVYESLCTAGLFFRTSKYKSNYMIVGGISEALEYIKNWKITEEHHSILNRLFESHPENLRNQVINYLMTLDINQLRIQFIPDGTIVGPNEPLIQLKGPLALLQLLETPLLNIIGHPTLVATKAFLIKTIIKDKTLYEFGLRRAQGPEAGLRASKYAYIGGASATSNVYTLMYNIPCVGTMAHSYITTLQHSTLEQALDTFKSLRTELKLKNLYDGTICDNFLQYVLDTNNLTETSIETNISELIAGAFFALSQPNNFVFLIDTYESIKSGLENYCYISNALIRLGYKPKGVRMDSGDLYKISIVIKNKFIEMSYAYPEYGDMKIIASNDLDIESIRNLENANAPIDIYAVGTNLVTGGESSSLGCVYKILDIGGQDIMKISTPEKAVLPASKNIYRLYGDDGKCVADIITLETETIEDLANDTMFEVQCWNPKNYDEQVNIKFLKYVQLLKTIRTDELKSTLTNNFLSNEQIELSKSNCVNQRFEFKEEHLTNNVKYNFYISSGVKNRVIELLEKNALE